jgi:hypothetical protein
LPSLRASPTVPDRAAPEAWATFKRSAAILAVLALTGTALSAPAHALVAKPAVTAKATGKPTAKPAAKSTAKPATKSAAKAKPGKARTRKAAKPVPPEPASEDVTQLTQWIIASGDTHGQPFMVIDKVAARVFVHNAKGDLIGATPALFGITKGDDSAEGVGDRELSQIKPEDRTTPAGRFVAKFGAARYSRNVLWVDYATSISLHPVITTHKKERRLERLKSATPDDNRITFGCINVPTAFYAKVVRPAFARTTGIVYILPETRPLNAVFLAYRPMVRPEAFSSQAASPDDSENAGNKGKAERDRSDPKRPRSSRTADASP